jgi:hypothetical protein
MKIYKKLKNAEFEYDEETKIFTIMDQDGFHGHVQLNKIYAFAFMRFVIRMAQRNWLRQIKRPEKSLDKDTPVNVCLKQMNFIEENEISDRVADHYLNNPKDLLSNDSETESLLDNEDYDSSSDPF